MKPRSIPIISFILIVALSACSSHKQLVSFNSYLLETVNNTHIFEIPALEIIDEKLYPILDTVISATESCKYFDNRIRYLYGFNISTRMDQNEDRIYTIHTRNSIGFIFGIIEGEIALDTKIRRGVFFYKNYTFSIALNEYLKCQNCTIPFYKKLGYTHRIKATELPNIQRVYDASILRFKIVDEQFVVIENNLCDN